MPQMKPMNWILLFIFMNLIIMFMNIKNFFMKNYKNFKNFKNLKKNNNNWTW